MIASPAGGRLSAWIDFDANGNWGDPGEQVFTDEPLAAGIVNPLSFAVPETAARGSTNARLRVSTVGGFW